MSDMGSGQAGGLMQALKTRMYWHQSRQKLLAENVSNADTPGFRPLDLKQPSLNGAASTVALSVTSPGHIAAGADRRGFDGTGARRFEITPNGNGVNLEDEMMKVAQNQGDFALAASLYSKGLGLMKIAIGKGR